MSTGTVEPPNKGQVGTSTNVQVVLYWGVFSKNPFYEIQGRILLQCGYKVVCVRIRKILQWNLRREDTLGTVFLSSLRRLSSSQRLLNICLVSPLE